MKTPIARIHHETNTFQPVPAPLAAFGRRGPDRSVIGIHRAVAVFGSPRSGRFRVDAAFADDQASSGSVAAASDPAT
ncbi:M81 family metallopeptidase [Burkholderia pyrrocinia]|uniref:M81 family metallopeptidase n=1 Tax=Burkholderia pyrrocinia TaxID=60550 RepID=UPI003D7698A6